VEYGCDRPRNRFQSKIQVITGIENTSLIEIDKAKQELQEVVGSAAFNRFKIQTTFRDEYVMEHQTSNYSAYAIPAPPAELSLQLDSIIIRNVATKDSLDITSSFALGVKDEGYQIVLTNDSLFQQGIVQASRPYQLVYDLYMIDSIDVSADYTFEVNYYLAGGGVFNSITEKVLITP
jgi:hypothetical protein